MHDHELHTPAGGVPIKAWTHGVAVEDVARRQLDNLARLPIVGPWVAVMPDVHWGMGATVGSVVPTRHAIIPAAVGVDIGCGMLAARTDLDAARLPDDLAALRRAVEKAVPHGRTDQGGKRDEGCWGRPPARVEDAWRKLRPGWERIVAGQPKLDRGKHVEQLGTLGTGNHFIELCLDESDAFWIVLHSGSRGPGNRIGTHFVDLAKKDMKSHLADLPDADLAYLNEGSPHFDEYVHAVGWAQDYAKTNRRLMFEAVVEALRGVKGMPRLAVDAGVVDCHHNYVRRETHFGEELLVTRKGAVRAGLGELGIVPGSMGAHSFIVRGKGCAESFESCSHGAGRAMSRGEAKRRFTLDDHTRATAGVECRKDAAVLDETPGAYKPIEAVMAAQRELIDVVHTLRQVVCIKG
ncbi:MAG: RtcB family protein [Planctomycetes bacterium]|nr:RtcB family protein [Planctomycetota bacterium]